MAQTWLATDHGLVQLQIEDMPPGVGSSATIRNGTAGPSGAVGSDGDFYIDTVAKAIYGPKAAGAWGSGTSLVGPTGTSGSNGSAGADGKTVRSGAGAPSGALGVDGDWYIDTTAKAIYGPKSSGAWGSATSLVGPQGSTGLQDWDTIVVTSGDQPTTNLTATDIPGLSVALLANTTYEFEVVLATNSSSTAGNKYAVNFSAAGAAAQAIYTGMTSATAVGSIATSALATLEGTAFNAVAADVVVTIWGRIKTGANAGNFTIQQAKVTSGTATVRKNSVLKVRAIGAN